MEDQEDQAEKKTVAEVVGVKKRRGPGRKAGQTYETLRPSQLVEIVALKHTGALGQRDIAKVVGCHESSVSRAVKKFEQVFESLKDVKDYREARAEILQALQLKSLQSLADPSKQERATVNQLAYTFEVLHKAERLELNKSTENKAVSFVKVTPEDDR